MADRSSKPPKREGTISSSVKRSENRVNKSRSPIITRSRSRGRDDTDCPDNSAIINRRSKRTSVTTEENKAESKKPKVELETQTKKPLHAKSKNNKPKPSASTSSSSQEPVASTSSQSFKKLKKEPEEKKTGSSIGTRKKVDLEASKSKASTNPGKHLKKSASLEDFKSKDPATLSASKKSLVMDQNGANFSNNNANASATTAAASTTSANNGSNSSSEGSNANPGTSNILSSYSVSAQMDPESDDNDMSRLQTILESRGLHPHFLGIPRMQNFFYRSLNNTSNSKAQQLLQALNSTTNESEKLHYVLEMCQLLLMGNEDTLVGFPIKTVVPTLINLLSMEHNFEIMHHACRALTYMMEALPRSSVVVLDAVPVFLEKLQVIQCMDVAEQSLSALEMLSRRHNKAILHARGVSACLTYLDFFSIDAQRSALTITANCFQNVTTDDFQYVQDSLPILSSHLSIEDKKCIESICLAFSRLVDCYQQDCAIISEIASSQLLTNIQNVLMTVPPILSTGSFVNVIRMLSIMCSSCSQISVELLKLNICETLKCLLLCNNSLLENSDTINLISRSPQEIYELTAFIAELMPSLPLDGIFSVDLLFSKANQASTEVAIWQWKDDRGLWHQFNVVDNKIIESAHQSGEDELELASLNRTYIIDFNSMQKIYEDTGNTYAIQRKINTFNNSEIISRSNMQSIDPRSEFIYKEQELSSSFLKFIFSILNEVYNNSAGFSVRYKCLNAILRIIYYTPKDLLYSILKDQSMSSSIATMLASPDSRIVVCATQMCNILMEKMPEIFSIFFQREGVIHQIRKLYSEESRFSMNDKSSELVNDSKSPNTFVISNSIILDNAQLFLNRHASSDSFSSIEYIAQNNNNITSAPVAHVTTKSSGATRQNSAPDPSTGCDEILKRKRTRKSIAISTSSRASSLNIGFDASTNAAESNANNNNSLTTANQPDQVSLCSNLSQSYFPLFLAEQVNNANLTISNNSNSSNTNSKSSTRLSSSKDFLQRLNPSRWARWTQSSVVQNTTNTVPTTSTVSSKDLSTLQKSSNANKEKIRSWVREQAKSFDDKYFLKTSDEDEKESSTSPNILKDLTESILALSEDKAKALTSIKKILLETDLSSFELIHSGLVKNLLTFLVGADCAEDIREHNLRTFLNIFYGVPLSDVIENIDELSLDSKPLSILISKLNACVSQLEQFPLRVNDYSNNSGSRGQHAIKFLSSHYLKVILTRHHTCTNLKKYKGPLIKLDPFTPVQSIERYLLTRGYGKIKDVDDEQSDDDVSDEDLIDNIAVSSSSQAQGARHRLQVLIGDHVLPYNMSIYQCIKQYMGNEYQEADSDNDIHMANSKFWSIPFPVSYRLANDTPATSGTVTTSTTGTAATAASNSASSSKSSSRRSKGAKSASKKKDEIWLDGKTANAISPLESYLKSSLSFKVPITDQSIEVLCLLRVLYGIIRYWGYLYKVPHTYNPAIPLKEFINYKLTVKANRQLQDPLVIMTSTLPNWLSEIAYACPFMFPFDTRYLLFYVVCFDRDRALQRLFENTPDFASLDSRERSIVPRLEKRKRIVSRTDIFKSAETLFNDLSGSKSLLEIQYENEVGTGLGPTLEFYALVSKEFQRADFEMWRGEVMSNCEFKDDKNEADSVSYVFSSNGLFPAPLGRSTKPSVGNKLKQRFKLLGKFMAKALMDSRMIDIPLNILFYKWLLNEQATMTIADIHQLDPSFSTSILQMFKIVQRKVKMNLNNNDDLLKLHGCPIEDLNLDFTLPGYSNIELRKGGRDMPVTIANLDNYINLVSTWNLAEGVTKQMEAFKEGFNSVFNSAHLKLFYPEELQQLFCGASYKSWDVKMLMESCKTDHGFTHDSKAIRFLFEILSSYNAEEQRKFLQFLTGSPRLPIGGFKSLIPPFTIVRKSNTESDNPNCLPSVMTCVNYLKLPDYPTIEIMREKLDTAINEGQFSFHLS